MAQSVRVRPFGPTRTSRNERDTVEARGARHAHLVGDALVVAARRFGPEEFWLAIFMLALAASGRRGVSFIEDAHMQKPHRKAGETDADAIASTFDGAPLQRRGDRYARDPRHDVVIDNENLRQLRPLWRPLPGEHA